MAERRAEAVIPNKPPSNPQTTPIFTNPHFHPHAFFIGKWGFGDYGDYILRSATALFLGLKQPPAKRVRESVFESP
jgi:hypothetical protein